MFPFYLSGKTNSIPFEIWDGDFDTGITTDSNILTLSAGGTEVATLSSTEGLFNTPVGFGGITSTQFSRDGATVTSYVLAKKPDIANANAAGYIMWSNETLRTTDFSILKAGGTEESPAAVTTADWLSNMRFEAMDTDLEFQTAASIRVEVYDTVASGAVSGELNYLVANNLGSLVNVLAMNYDQMDFFGGEVRMTSEGDLAINRNQNNVGLRLYTENDNNTIRARSNGFSSGEDSLGFFVGTPNSRIGLNGSIGYHVTTVATATHTVGIDDYFLSVTRTASGACGVAMPAGSTRWQAGATMGPCIIVADTGANAGANNITITPNGSDTFIGASTGLTSATINSDGGVLMFQLINSTTWKVMQLY